MIATGGQAGDSPQALPLLADLQPGKVLADTAYDSDATRPPPVAPKRALKPLSLRIRAARKPCRWTQKRSVTGNKVERFFGWLKQSRRLATR